MHNNLKYNQNIDNIIKNEINQENNNNTTPNSNKSKSPVNENTIMNPSP